MPPAPSISPSGLWDFSLRQYARPGVADVCLQLQDEQGANVNLLLWCAWLDARGVILDAARLHQARKRICSWDEHYVIPLRQLRRRIKAEFGVANPGIEAVRTQIKQAELLAEKQLQLCLEEIALDWNDDDKPRKKPSVDWYNVRFYLQQLRVTDPVIAQLLAVLEPDKGAPA